MATSASAGGATICPKRLRGAIISWLVKPAHASSYSKSAESTRVSTLRNAVDLVRSLNSKKEDPQSQGASSAEEQANDNDRKEEPAAACATATTITASHHRRSSRLVLLKNNSCSRNQEEGGGQQEEADGGDSEQKTRKRGRPVGTVALVASKKKAKFANVALARKVKLDKIKAMANTTVLLRSSVTAEEEGGQGYDFNLPLTWIVGLRDMDRLQKVDKDYLTSVLGYRTGRTIKLLTVARLPNEDHTETGGGTDTEEKDSWWPMHNKRQTRRFSKRWSKRPSPDKLRKRAQLALLRALKLQSLNTRLLPHVTYLSSLLDNKEHLRGMEETLNYPYGHLLEKIYVVHYCLEQMCKGACLRWAIDQARCFFRRISFSESTAYRWVGDFLSVVEGQAEGGVRDMSLLLPFTPYLKGSAGVTCVFEENEDMKKEAIAWVRQNRMRIGEKNMTSEDFKDFLNNYLFPKYRIDPKPLLVGVERVWVYDRYVKMPTQQFRTVGATCAKDILHRVGFSYCGTQGGVFSDGHDEDSNVSYRNTVFLPKIWKVFDRSHLFVPPQWLAKRDGWYPGQHAHYWDKYKRSMMDPALSEAQREAARQYVRAHVLAASIEDTIFSPDNPPQNPEFVGEISPFFFSEEVDFTIYQADPASIRSPIPHPYHPQYGTHVDRFEWISSGTTGGHISEAAKSDLFDRFVEFGDMGGELRHDYDFVHGKDSKPYILLAQDETIVRLHDSQKAAWADKKHKNIRHKHPGKGLMFSGFVMEARGFPVLPTPPEGAPPLGHPLFNLTTQVTGDGSLATLTLGNGIERLSRTVCLEELDYTEEGYWNCERMMAQTNEVVKLVKHLYPDYDIALLYDASSGHHKYSEDALVATRLRKGSGGKQPIMRDTEVPEDELGPDHVLDPIYMGNGDVKVDHRGIPLFRQSFAFAEDDYIIATGETTLVEVDPVTKTETRRELTGLAKGLEQVLLERGVDTSGMTLWGTTTAAAPGENEREGGGAEEYSQEEGDEDEEEDESSLTEGEENGKEAAAEAGKKEECRRGYCSSSIAYGEEMEEEGENEEENMNRALDDLATNGVEDTQDFWTSNSFNGFPLGRVKNKANSMYYILGQRFSDFRNERSALQRLIEDELGCTFIALPKYHCELNPIEYVWGGGKRKFRKINDHTWPGLRKRAKKCFLQLPLQTVAKLFRKARDFMRALSDGNDSTTMYTYVKEECKQARAKGKSHWRPPASLCIA